MFQKVGDATAASEFLSREEEARGGVTEYREIVENNPAYLHCDTNAVPPPEFTWYREDQPLSAAGGLSVLQGRQRSWGVGGQAPGSYSHQSCSPPLPSHKSSELPCVLLAV